MDNLEFIPVTQDKQIRDLAVLAEEIWNEHFTPIIGKAQVDYMVEKFQSYPALKGQLEEGYEYFQILCDGKFVGYIGVHQEDGDLFLSKLYLHKDSRGRHLATKAFAFLVDLCRRRGLGKIWLTCNRNNTHTLDVYHHLGLVTTRTQVADIGNGFVMDDYILEYPIP